MEIEHNNMLKKIVVDLKQLGEIFLELQRADALTTQSGVDELRAREKITNYLFLVWISVFLSYKKQHLKKQLFQFKINAN